MSSPSLLSSSSSSSPNILKHTHTTRRNITNTPLWNRLLPFQKEGVRFAVEKCHGRVLFADEMGLGKTVEAIATAFAYAKEWPLIVFSPASLKYNWADELEKWLSAELSSQDVNIVRSSVDFERIVSSKVSIVSYGMMVGGESPVAKTIKELEPQVVILDESHNIKSRKAKRTLAIMPLLKQAKRAILMSGTPALSRPVELWTQLFSLRPDVFGLFTPYAKKYCNARRGRFGWDYSGSSNLPELHRLLTTNVMIRRLKRDVQRELPPKVRQRIQIDLSKAANAEMRKSLGAMRKRAKTLRDLEARGNAASAQLESLAKKQQSSLMACYPETANAKVGSVAKYLTDVVLPGMVGNDEGKKILVFAHHKVMMDEIEKVVVKHLKKSRHIRIDGSTPSIERHRYVKQFQSDDKTRVAVLSMHAAGTGLTLTKATCVIFAELTWNPGTIRQCEDRAHRIGQSSSVQIIYLVAKHTIDEILWGMINRKTMTLGKMLDAKCSKLSADLTNASGRKKRGRRDDDNGDGNKEGMATKRTIESSACDDFDSPRSVRGTDGSKKRHKRGGEDACTFFTPPKRRSGTPSAARRKTWTCPLCTYAGNQAFNPSCVVCHTTPSTKSDDSRERRAWLCSICTLSNAGGERCVACSSPRPSVTASAVVDLTAVELPSTSANNAREILSSSSSSASSQKRKRRLLYFAVSKASGRIFVHDGSAIRRYLGVNYSRDEIDVGVRSLLGGIAGPLEPPLDVPARLEEARQFLRSWTRLRVCDQNKMFGRPLRPPLVVPRGTVQPHATKLKSYLRFRPQSAPSSLLPSSEMGDVPVARHTQCETCSKPLDTSAASIADWQRRFCSFDCSRSVRHASSSSRIRRAVFANERGVCQICKFDTHSFFRRFQAMDPPERFAVLQSEWPNFRVGRSDRVLCEPKEGGKRVVRCSFMPGIHRITFHTCPLTSTTFFLSLPF